MADYLTDYGLYLSDPCSPNDRNSIINTLTLSPTVHIYYIFSLVPLLKFKKRKLHLVKKHH